MSDSIDPVVRALRQLEEALATLKAEIWKDFNPDQLRSVTENLSWHGKGLIKESDKP